MKKDLKKRQGKKRAASGGAGYKGTIAIVAPKTFYGLNLLPRLKAQGEYRIIGLGRDEVVGMGPDNAFYSIDLTQPGSDLDVTKILKEEKADALVHLSFLETPAYNASWEHEVEAVGTHYVFNACHAAGIKKIVIASTTAIYGAYPQNPNLLTEEHFLKDNKGSQIFPDRVEAEREAFKYLEAHKETEVAILRFAPALHRKADNFVSRYFSLPICPTVMGFDPLWQLLHPSDAVEALFYAVTQKLSGEYNIVGRGAMPVSQIIKFLGKKKLPLPTPAFMSAAHAVWAAQAIPLHPGLVHYFRYPWMADGEKAERTFGFRARYSIIDILREFRGEVALDKTIAGS